MDCFIALSEAVRKSLVSAGIEPARIEIVHKAYDPSWQRAEQTNLRQKLGIPKEVFVVGTVANARKTKGLEYLIRSASLLGRFPEKFAIVIVGRDRGGRLRGEVGRLREQPRGKECPVYLAGEIPDAFRVLRSFDCFVMPSLREGLGKAAIEAMSDELAVVVTNVGGLPKLVQHEKNGLLIPPRSPVAIAGAVLRLANEPTLRRTLAQAAKRTISERFTVENMVDKTVRTYERFLAQK